MTLNRDLRKMVVNMVTASGEGHIPSSFSIIDIVNHLYTNVLRVDPANPKWSERDYFVLSKGHGAAGFYAVLRQHGFLTDEDIANYSSSGGILGGHPDVTTVPGVEASTGSLGHGFPMAVGIALGLRIRGMNNRVFCLLGDGECHEGTVWEAANVANNLCLGNLCAIVDWNGSAAQLMPLDDLPAKWRAFGWKAVEVDGHSDESLADAFGQFDPNSTGRPFVVVATTTKGKGVSFVEGHGAWHHRVPNDDEILRIMKELA